MRGLTRRTCLVVALALLTTLRLVAVTPAAPVRLSPAAAAAAIRAIEKDRADTQAWLRSDPTSYLATIDRRDFLGKPALTVGRARDNDVRIDDPGDADVQAHHLRVTLDGDRFRVEAVDATAQFRATVPATGAPAAGAAGNIASAPQEQAIRTATLDPGNIRVGRFLIRLSHQRFPALIVFDPSEFAFQGIQGAEVLQAGFGVPLRAVVDAESDAGRRPRDVDAREPAAGAACWLVRFRRRGAAMPARSAPAAGAGCRRECAQRVLP